jgi:hypothetical protein
MPDAPESMERRFDSEGATITPHQKIDRAGKESDRTRETKIVISFKLSSKAT